MSVFTEHLSGRFQTLAPDLRGYGKTRTAEPFSMTDHLVDLEALLDQFKIDRCCLIGWSLGGVLSLELALRQPQRLAGLVLIATAARPRGNHPPITGLDYVYTGVAGLINAAIPGWQWNIETFGKRSLFRYLIQQHTPATYRYLAREAIPAFLQTSSGATRALNAVLGTGYSRLTELPDLDCPCLVMAGEADRHITAESSLETARHLKNSQWHCYPQTAHLFPWEIPQQVLADLDHWLENQSFLN